jgi:hypothetical protein
LSFVDAKNLSGTIFVSERSDSGEFISRQYPAEYVAYEEDPIGQYKSITGKRLRKISFTSKRAFQDALTRAKEHYRTLWESDINPTFRFLEKHYPDDSKLPPLHISIFDIEVDRDQQRGYSPTDNPFNPIISVTVYHKWKDQAITIAVPPPNMTMA